MLTLKSAVNLTALAVLFVLTMYPSLVTCGAAVYKWRDDGWTLSSFVKYSLGVSSFFLLAFVGGVAPLSLWASLSLLALLLIFAAGVGGLALWIRKGCKEVGCCGRRRGSVELGSGRVGAKQRHGVTPYLTSSTAVWLGRV